MPVSVDVGSLYDVKTTIDIADALLTRAKRHARRVGKPLRAIVEEGIRRVVDEEQPAVGYRVPDRSVGNPRGENPLEALSWEDLRDQVYGGR